MLDYNDAKEFENRILSFCKSHKKIYLYGAGVFGRIYYEYLVRNHFSIESFLTTNDQGELFGRSVKRYVDSVSLLDSDCGVILSVKKESQKDIMQNNIFPCDVFVPDSHASIYIDVNTIFKNEFFNSTMCKKAECYQGEELKNILIVQMEVTFGDMIWSSAFIRELRNIYTNARITMVINPIFKDLYEHCPYINNLVFYDSKQLTNVVSEAIVKKSKKFAEENLCKEYDAVFLPRLLPYTSLDSWENVLLAVYSDAKYRFGHVYYITDENRFRYNLIRNLFSDIAVHRDANHEAYNDLEMIKLLGHKPSKMNMELWLDDDSKEYAKRVVSGSKYVIVVGVVGSKNNRSWSPEKYGVLFNRLLKESGSNTQIILLGGNDAVYAAGIIQEMTSNRCTNLSGKTSLMQCAAVIANSSLYVGSDTGLMHMASASGVPVIEISASNKTSPDYWGSSATRTGPWQVPAIVLQPEKGLDDCKYMCVKSYSHCINQICEDEVYNAINKLRHD